MPAANAAGILAVLGLKAKDKNYHHKNHNGCKGIDQHGGHIQLDPLFLPSGHTDGGAGCSVTFSVSISRTVPMIITSKELSKRKKETGCQEKQETTTKGAVYPY